MRDNEFGLFLKSLNQVFIQKSSLFRERNEEREEGRREEEVRSKFQPLIRGMKQRFEDLDKFGLVLVDMVFKVEFFC